MRPKDPALLATAASIRSLRTTLGWSQRELARRAGSSQTTVSAIELATRAALTFVAASSMLRAMGARLVVSVDAPFLGDRRRQRDAGHIRLAASTVQRLRRSGWEARVEVEVGGDRSRGWIDILAFHPGLRLVLVIELKTEIHDFGQIERSLGWYEREARLVATRFGWRPTRVLGVLLLLATEANDARVASNRAAIELGFPVRFRTLDRIVRELELPAERGRAVAMIDPASRRPAWCRPLRLDGRRARAPYADYADFMRATRTRASRRAGSR
ncbi:MAG: helix-turn-helix domain-containing protein [Candidatus Limnocylindrales bacterium]